MVQLVHLPLKDTNPDNMGNNEKRNLKVVDVLMESRVNHNEIVRSVNLIMDEINSIKTQLEAVALKTELQESVEFLDREVKETLLPNLTLTLKTDLKRVKTDLKLQVDENEKMILNQEAHSRRRNVIINGLHETDGEEIGEVVREFFTDKMKIPEGVVDNFLYRDFHRLPRSNKAPPTSAKPIIVAFIKQSDRNLVMRKAYELKGTTISIKSDLPKFLNELRSEMLKERTRLKEANPEIAVRVSERMYKPVLQVEESRNTVNGVVRIKWRDLKFP